MVLLLFFVFGTLGVDYNINIRFSQEDEQKIIDLTQSLSSTYGVNNQIDFSKCAPHITLYLTLFKEEVIPRVVERIAKAIENLRGCNITLDTAEPSGNYYMFNAAKSDCLSTLSESIVNLVCPYYDKSYVCPSWVDGITDEEKKTTMKFNCDHYGSPNVFTTFSPHVTLFYNDDTTLINKLPKTLEPIKISSTKVSMTVSGNYGTAERGKENMYGYLYDPLIEFN
ncbi:hypothetical protein EIN_404590 [Entamoeba invadens IP1]|uniref:Uncharacterized protein n=1 Tax=Entamoeba invadens IP1 TaxID=370355 RepID=A0A0A1U6W4_ENTIV|nr:hypothetical protein EIN_404590 [Entamoeba invadens IP1]ELP90065.1 hypothetical protein EIN_404590 [Entamoeba invadens IP1]|eukprot:XP_004256836.1 hypothetical protein EIN_404590 [Entamoeba invadens IP1]